MVESSEYTEKQCAATASIIPWFRTALSFNTMADLNFLMEQYMKMDLEQQYYAAIGGSFTTFFAAWIMSKLTSEELGGHGNYRIWRFLAKYFSPIAILVIFLQAIGWI